MTTKIVIISAILYTLWVGFYLVFSIIDIPSSLVPFLTLFQQQETIIQGVSFGFIVSGLICTIIAAGRIEGLKYTPSILVAVFILSGRLISFTGDYIFLQITGRTLFLVPFGSIDFFLFYFLSMGLFTFLRKEDEISVKTKFSVLFLIPLLLYTLPVLTHLKTGGFTLVSVYSFIFTSVAVLTMIAAIGFWAAYPNKKLLALSIIIAVLLDMLVYLEFTTPYNYLPPMLNYLFLPYAIFLFTYAVTGVEGKLND